MIVPPGRRRPSRSAASTMRMATRSLMEPPGLKYSTLATICGAHPCPIRLRRTSGVSPTVSRMESLISADVAVGVMEATIGRVSCHGRRGVHRRVTGLPAGQFGLGDRALLDQFGQRVVGHRSRDLRDTGDLRRADAWTL